jgi:type IV secretory pathway TrbL component
MNDLTMTNVWLGILAVVSLIEFLIIAAAGFMAFRAYKQVMVVVQNIERDHVAPLRARVDAILDEVQVITGKVRHAQDSVSAALHTASSAGSIIAGSVKAKAWPIIGVLRGVRNIASTMFSDGKHDQPYITANN